MEQTSFPTRAVWYVQTALTRALDFTLQEIRKYEAVIDNEDVPESTRNDFRGFVSYQRQWLREAQESFLTLPKELQPHHQVVAEVTRYFDERSKERQGY